MLNVLNFDYIINLGFLPNLGITIILTLLIIGLFYFRDNWKMDKVDRQIIIFDIIFGILIALYLYIIIVAVHSLFLNLHETHHIHWF